MQKLGMKKYAKNRLYRRFFFIIFVLKEREERAGPRLPGIPILYEGGDSCLSTIWLLV